MANPPDPKGDTGPLSVLRHCLNPKVLVGLASVGLLVWLVQPNLIRPILPVLFLLACPLSMLFMMRAMHGSSEPKRDDQPLTATAGRDDRASELRERLARARAEEAVLETELVRLERRSESDDQASLRREPDTS